MYQYNPNPNSARPMGQSFQDARQSYYGSRSAPQQPGQDSFQRMSNFYSSPYQDRSAAQDNTNSGNPYGYNPNARQQQQQGPVDSYANAGMSRGGFDASRMGAYQKMQGYQNDPYSQQQPGLGRYAPPGINPDGMTDRQGAYNYNLPGAYGGYNGMGGGNMYAQQQHPLNQYLQQMLGQQGMRNMGNMQDMRGMNSYQTGPYGGSPQDSMGNSYFQNQQNALSAAQQNRQQPGNEWNNSNNSFNSMYSQLAQRNNNQGQGYSPFGPRNGQGGNGYSNYQDPYGGHIGLPPIQQY